MEGKNDRARRGRVAFTLLEVLLLLVVLGILIGIAVPSLARSQRRYAALTAARTLRADIAHARLRAILDAATVRVIMDTTRGQYRLEVDRLEADRLEADRLEGAGRKVIRERRLAPGLTLRTSAHRQEILFSARGTSNLYSTTWVGVGRDPDARWHRVRVVPTGAIEAR
jgi:Tfp pilus assembly protein FimT